MYIFIFIFIFSLPNLCKIVGKFRRQDRFVVFFFFFFLVRPSSLLRSLAFFPLLLLFSVYSLPLSCFLFSSFFPFFCCSAWLLFLITFRLVEGNIPVTMTESVQQCISLFRVLCITCGKPYTSKKVLQYAL